VVVVEETAEVGCGRHVDIHPFPSFRVSFPMSVSHSQSLVLAARPLRRKPTVAFVRLVPRALKVQRDILAEVVAATRGCSSR
jgi:hypothetical protein